MAQEEKKTEQQQFIDELTGTDKADVLETPLEGAPTDEVDETEDPETVEPEVKNRRHRRLEQKLQAEREANIALNARLQVIAEAKTTSADSDYLKNVEKIYGTDSPEAIAATDLLKTALLAVEEKATEKALSRFQEERANEQREVAKEEEKLDSFVDDIEEQYGVSFTPELETYFFKALAKVSPKDEDGNVTEYADHHAVWESIQERISKKPDSQAKTLSARSLTTSGSSVDSTLLQDSAAKYLKEEGII